jgi:hypothetical protein
MLRSVDLEEAWEEGWEAVITNMVLASPVVVFIGLGSPAAVLTESVRRIRGALNEPNSVFYVSPGDPEQSEFFVDLDLTRNACVSMGWMDFMRELSNRIVEEHKNSLVAACEHLTVELNLKDEDADSGCNR